VSTNQAVEAKPLGQPDRHKLELKEEIGKAISPTVRATASSPQEDRRNGLILCAINQMMGVGLNLDPNKVPHEADELIAAGIAPKDVGAIQVWQSLDPNKVPHEADELIAAGTAPKDVGAIQVWQSLDPNKVPHEADELIAAGIAPKDVGAIQVWQSLGAQSNVQSDFQFPPNKATLNLLRGMMTMTRKVEVKESELPTGDPDEDAKLLNIFNKLLGPWTRPFLALEEDLNKLLGPWAPPFFALEEDQDPVGGP
jgi:hypothetical protein